jgi:hypothetical protein
MAGGAACHREWMIPLKGALNQVGEEWENAKGPDSFSNRVHHMGGFLSLSIRLAHAVFIFPYGPGCLTINQGPRTSYGAGHDCCTRTELD